MNRTPRKPSFAFNECASDRSPVPDRGLTFVIRTDAAFATSKLQAEIVNYIRSTPNHPLHNKKELEAYVTQITHSAYQVWGHDVLTAKAECLDYSKYNLQEPGDKSLHVHFYNAHALTRRAIEQAEKMLAADPNYDPSLPVMFVSLDDMIVKQREPWADIGFSRIFDHKGQNHFGYTGRPGMRPISDQIAAAKAELAALSQQHGGRKIPVVLLEDNVRHAKMLNWVIDLLDQQDVFDHADLAAISTCFCCASEAEREKIKQGGKTVPMTIVIDYEQSLVDVCTPRDLMLDGFVVEVNGNTTRLPGIFMDVAERFKIKPGKENLFKKQVLDANVAFCELMEGVLQLEMPLKWFKGADAIAHVTGATEQTPMRAIMQDLRRGLPTVPGNDNDKDAPSADSAPSAAPKAP